jgi:MFS superfamily sulfate permease-like transporter
MRDVVTSLTVAVVALGFGFTLGMSAAAGPTTAIVACFLAALLGGSRY